MQDVVIDTDVLIVGAGPVGLFLANECARRGLRWRLVETRASQSVHSKALAIRQTDVRFSRTHNFEAKRIPRGKPLQYRKY